MTPAYILFYASPSPVNFDVSTTNCLGSWRVERCWLQSPPLSCYMTGSFECILQIPTIALLLHRLSHVTQCVYVLTKALFLFILLLKIAYMELMVGKKEASTCVKYIAKSNNGSMEMKNHTSWSRLCTHVENGWWMIKIKDSLHESLSPFIWMTWGHGYIIFFFFLGHSCVHFFGSCFFGTKFFLSRSLWAMLL